MQSLQIILSVLSLSDMTVASMRACRSWEHLFQSACLSATQLDFPLHAQSILICPLIIGSQADTRRTECGFCLSVPFLSREAGVETYVASQPKPSNLNDSRIATNTAGGVQKTTARSVQKSTSEGGQKSTAFVQKSTAVVQKSTAVVQDVGVQKSKAGGGQKSTAFVQKNTAGGSQKSTSGSIQKITAGGVQKSTTGGVQNGAAGGVQNGTTGGVQKSTSGGVQNGAAGGVQKKVVRATVTATRTPGSAQENKASKVMKKKTKSLLFVSFSDSLSLSLSLSAACSGH